VLTTVGRRLGCRPGVLGIRGSIPHTATSFEKCAIIETDAIKRRSIKYARIAVWLPRGLKSYID